VPRFYNDFDGAATRCLSVELRLQRPASRLMSGRRSALNREEIMKGARLAVTIVLAAAVYSGGAMGDTGRTYKHPSLDFRFQASPRWIRVPRPEDDMIYEVMDSDSIVHVVLWYTTTEQDAYRYLMKMADMKGLAPESETSKIRIGQSDALVLDATGTINDVPIHTFLAVIEHGKSALHPRENALYIAQLWCRENVYGRHAQSMRDILRSIEITAPLPIIYNRISCHPWPALLDSLPDMPSPCTIADGTEIVVCFTHDDRYAVFPVTQENGEPLDYENGQWWGKGAQLEVDTLDFPTLAGTGLHAEEELRNIESITNRSIAEITRIGRPGAYSGAGFLGHEEDVVSVIRDDNVSVTRLGSTHPEIVKPLFHVFNVILSVRKDSDRANIRGIIYNQRKIFLKFRGSKGWQESIFDDEILGYWRIEIWRDIEREEEMIISRAYSGLAVKEMDELKRKLSYIHTGEMVPFYIMRYGFYEGHTAYRADPISIAFIFGLRSMEDIERSFSGELYEILAGH
jgi:hypothetical protein